jgi:hypothetical protein
MTYSMIESRVRVRTLKREEGKMKRWGGRGDIYITDLRANGLQSIGCGIRSLMSYQQVTGRGTSLCTAGELSGLF